MDKRRTLLNHLHHTLFNKWFLFLFIFIMKGCHSVDKESMHYLYLKNTTQYSLKFQIVRSSVSNTPGWVRLLPPNSNQVLGDGATHLSGNDITFQTIRENFGLSTDTVEILRNDTIIIKWGGPLRVMPDSINHFYNEKSWKIEMGGTNNAYEIGTFTIYETDIGHIEVE